MGVGIFCLKRCLGKPIVPPRLEEIGKEIAIKCGGHPLAIVVLGGLLSKVDENPEFWQYVAENISLAITGSDSSFMEILSLSYSHLPQHLKACFLYMGAFPEGREIHVSHLIKLWVAEEFIKPVGDKSLEEVAKENLKDLIDRNLVRVWDRRCFVSRGEAAGVLMGHMEGITFIDTRGDGRYFISNGKDQAIKLWDIRKMSSNVNYTPRRRYAEWDYRWMEYPEQAKNLKHPDDLSLVTYKGHTVLRTLIRCYFSPAYSTGQKYIYTGSTDSSVYVYDVISGDQVAKLDYHEDPVRDCNWHPYYPMLVSSSWDGMLASWEFPGKAENPVAVKRTRRRRRFFY
ncbi:hypothetical protein RD792_017225 [Penstemon davidsonii]|uniref:Disease resistance protein winged helix domain-containing protein n=1 Tax=Penstemon davidsonii TaxID=160366 RepID=A0ABR0CLF8_9LAMI|nr:hypothetical protein RD792_017225 [Penstemon davidsonii]